MRWLLFLACCAFFTLAHGCSKRAEEPPRKELPASFITIAHDSLEIRSGKIGLGKKAWESSYVLVSAENDYSKSVTLSLGGALFNQAGEQVAELRAEYFVIPPHRKRIYSLATKEQKVFSDAVEAKIQVIGVHESIDKSPVRITETHIHSDRDRVTLKAYAENHASYRAKVMVFGAFYDGEGKPLQRPGMYLVIPAKTKKLVQFEGPVHSRKGHIYVGEMAF